jgi:hypothetical protein
MLSCRSREKWESRYYEQQIPAFTGMTMGG